MMYLYRKYIHILYRIRHNGLPNFRGELKKKKIQDIEKNLFLKKVSCHGTRGRCKTSTFILNFALIL